jgi:tetratricopeptide (TPR) repeat protein
MPLFPQTREYDRTRLLDDATRARLKRRRRKAIRLYRLILTVEPENADLHAKLAPLLAEAGKRFDARLHFRAAAQLREDRAEKALATYREAAACLPRDLDVWLEMAELQRRRGEPAAAVSVLLDARSRFRRRRLRPQAIYLLRRVREHEPWHLDATLDLVRLLARSGQCYEALMLVGELAKRSRGAQLCRVRAARFRITHALGDLWSWLREAARVKRAAWRADAARRSRTKLIEER